MAAEARVRTEGISAAVMPTPQAIVASCGLSLRFSPDVSQQVQRLLNDEVGKDFYRIYEAVRDGGKVEFHPLQKCVE